MEWMSYTASETHEEPSEQSELYFTCCELLFNHTNCQEWLLGRSPITNSRHQNREFDEVLCVIFPN